MLYNETVYSILFKKFKIDTYIWLAVSSENLNDFGKGIGRLEQRINQKDVYNSDKIRSSDLTFI